MSQLFSKIMQKLVRYFDPKLEKYRPKKAKAEKYTPKSQKELIELLARTPIEALNKQERATITGVMGMGGRKVQSIMLAKEKMVFVHENEFLGPLLLDELYKSGFEHFPALGASGRITGLIHMRDLNKINQLDGQDRVRKYLDEDIYYIREDNSLEQALAAFIRTNCHFFIVINRTGNPVGLLEFAVLMRAVLGREISDDFNGDLNIAQVVARK